MKITSVDLKISAVRRSQYPTDERPEYLLVGRSNVGKSSFINTLINRKNYARTSATPGKTQTINFYLVNEDFLKSIKIDQESLDKDDIEMLEDMIVVAINSALNDIDKVTEEKMGKYTKGMPGLF